MRGRHAYAMLRMMGVTRTVARDKDDVRSYRDRAGKGPSVSCRHTHPGRGPKIAPVS